MDELDPVAALTRLGAVSDGTTLRRHCDPWQLRRAARAGRIAHLGKNRYALPGAHQAHVAAGRLHGVASHLSAAMAWGWKVKRPPARPVVTVPRGRKLEEERREGIDVHWRSLPSAALDGLVTSRVQTVIDCARTLPFDEALTVADSALREGRVTREDLLAAARAAPRTGRARAVRVVELADGRATPWPVAGHSLATLTHPGFRDAGGQPLAGSGLPRLLNLFARRRRHSHARGVDWTQTSGATQRWSGGAGRWSASAGTT